MNDSIYILILVVLGLFIAYRTAQSSNRREQTHNGLAKIFNFIAAGFIAMLAPTVLCNLIFIHPDFMGPVNVLGVNITTFAHVIVIALVMIAIGLLCLIPYAILEKPHLDKLAQQEDQGWTREKAETSGL
ncbi:MAG: hypothetical protein Phog2KO_27720 [Phototrophicaceae bacterium]